MTKSIMRMQARITHSKGCRGLSSMSAKAPKADSIPKKPMIIATKSIKNGSSDSSLSMNAQFSSGSAAGTSKFLPPLQGLISDNQWSDWVSEPQTDSSVGQLLKTIEKVKPTSLLPRIRDTFLAGKVPEEGARSTSTRSSSTTAVESANETIDSAGSNQHLLRDCTSLEFTNVLQALTKRVRNLEQRIELGRLMLNLVSHNRPTDRWISSNGVVARFLRELVAEERRKCEVMKNRDEGSAVQQNVTPCLNNPNGIKTYFISSENSLLDSEKSIAAFIRLVGPSKGLVLALDCLQELLNTQAIPLGDLDIAENFPEHCTKIATWRFVHGQKVENSLSPIELDNAVIENASQELGSAMEKHAQSQVEKTDDNQLRERNLNKARREFIKVEIARENNKKLYEVLDVLEATALTKGTKEQTLRSNDWSNDRSNEGIPVGNRFISIYSDFVCDNTAGMNHDLCTRYMGALANPVLPVDEFWMFILAKRVQDDIVRYTGSDIVSIAFGFANRYLEDDDFFHFLAEELMDKDGLKWGSLTSLEKSRFLWSCGKLRYRDEELIKRGLVELRADKEFFQSSADGRAIAQSTNVADNLSDESMTLYRELVSAIGSLDVNDLIEPVLDPEFFKELACKMRIAASSGTDEDEWVFSTAIPAIYLNPNNRTFNRAALNSMRALLSSTLHILTHNSKWVGGKLRTVAGRRLRLIQYCIELGMLAGPGEEPFDTLALPLLKQIGQVSKKFEKASNDTGNEPDSSGFHLEVATTLDQMRIRYALEKKVNPFVLDLVLNPVSFDNVAEDNKKLEQQRLKYVFQI